MKTLRIKDAKLDEIILADETSAEISSIVPPPESIYRFILNSIDNKNNITVLSNQLSALNNEPIPKNPLFTAEQISTALELSGYQKKSDIIDLSVDNEVLSYNGGYLSVKYDGLSSALNLSSYDEKIKLNHLSLNMNSSNKPSIGQLADLIGCIISSFGGTYIPKQN